MYDPWGKGMSSYLLRELELSMRGYPATVAVYLAALFLRFGGPVNQVKDYVLSMLLKRDIDVTKAQKALDALLKILVNEPDIDGFVESLEEKYYDRFKDALYFYIKINKKSLREVKNVIQTLLQLRMKAEDKTKRGSFKLSMTVFSDVKPSELSICGTDITVGKLWSLGFFIILLKEELLLETYHIITPAPYVDVSLLRLFKV